MKNLLCPACTKPLSELVAGDITLDACTNGCGGVWFDQDEILKFDEKHEFKEHVVLDLAKKKASVKVDPSKQKKCPKCEGEPIVRQFFDVKNEIEIDVCWKCGGVWLDVGEINSVRAQYETYEDRGKAVNAYVDTILTDTAQTLKANTAVKIERHAEATKGPLRAVLYALKQMLGVSDPYMDL